MFPFQERFIWIINFAFSVKALIQAKYLCACTAYIHQSVPLSTFPHSTHFHENIPQPGMYTTMCVGGGVGVWVCLPKHYILRRKKRTC